MPLEYETYEEARKSFKWSDRWEIFDGNRENFNIAHECIDRHSKEKIAIRIKFDDGKREVYTFGEISRLTSQFANMLEGYGIDKGDRVSIVLKPALEFYVSLFGTLKRGAIVVPGFPLFGPEAIEFRIRNSDAKMLITTEEKATVINSDIVSRIVTSEDLQKLIRNEDECYNPNTSANDLAVIQFSSGTTGAPKPVPYAHKSLALTGVTVKFGVGLRDDDNFFCPSSPAWGHGIWYGTMGPLAFGNAVGAYSGKFNPELFLEALDEFEITNVSATPMVYRLVMNCGKIDEYQLKVRRLTYTGATMQIDVIRYLQEKLGVVPHSFYGTSELGVIALDYAFKDWKVKAGSIGKPMLGLKVAVIDENENELSPGQVGRVAILRKGNWIRLGDAAYIDEDGYFWYVSRVDDVIKSAGYTIGPLEIEQVLRKHPSVLEAAVVGSPDRERGEIVKAFIVTKDKPSIRLKQEIQQFVKTRLSKHEYPREVEFVTYIPKTIDGKIKRKELRKREKVQG
jgi:acetyl-CoA synthetase